MMKGRKMKMARWNGGGEREEGGRNGREVERGPARTLGKFQRETRRTE